MPKLLLKFDNGEDSLDVRWFGVHEEISEPFSIEVMARSRKHDLDLNSFVGRPASLLVESEVKHLHHPRRHWTGICQSCEQVQAETEGLSTYQLTIVPTLWLLTQRTNFRVFQGKSAPDIAVELLKHWGLEVEWKLDRSKYPKLDYRVQYDESDYSFLSRLIEEAGIDFTLIDHDTRGSVVTFSDALHLAEAKEGTLVYADNPNQAANRAFVTNVQLSHELKPGALVLRDYDFRRPEFNLMAEAPKADGAEAKYELFDYTPGDFVAQTGKDDGTPAADARGAARHDLSIGNARAQRLLEAERVDQQKVSFETNTVDLFPGAVFRMAKHRHPYLADDKKLLVTNLRTEGSAHGEWHISGDAVFAAMPYRPKCVTPRPVVSGVQSATVVGPKGEEIHTDEFGRVRIQFPWDRYGKFDDQSSCWVRASQGWAGTGFGMITIPRVNQEVLVGFLEGNPNQPIIVGRVFNVTQPVPYKLPEHKTRSTWRSNSSPGGGGYNEITFEDKKDSELIFIQAQKDLRKLVKNDETITVGRDRRRLVKRDEIETTKRHRTEVTGGDRLEINDKNRTTVVGGNAATLVKGNVKHRTDGNHLVYVAKNQHLVVEKERRELVGGDSHLTVNGNRNEKVTGQQSLIVGGDMHAEVGKSFALEAGKEIHLQAGDSLVIEATREVTLKGPGGFVKCDLMGVTIKGNMVFINSGSAQAGSGSGASPVSADAAERIEVKEPKRPEVDDVSERGIPQ